MENRVYLIIGSNQGDKRMLLARAEELINLRVGVVQLRSSCYETEAWGFETEATFYNRVLDVDCRLAPAELLARCLDIEMCLGVITSYSIHYTKLYDHQSNGQCATSRDGTIRYFNHTQLGS